MNNNNEHRITAIKSELKHLEARRQILLSELKELTSPDVKAEISTTFLGEKAFDKDPETPDEKIQLLQLLYETTSW
jgi:hypothetical protein